MMPPGRRSISTRGFVKPCGLHHCWTCFGSVHASNTRSRGASNSRVMTTSCCVESVVRLLGAVMVALLGLQVTKVVVQSIEAVFPEAAILLKPVGRFFQLLYLQADLPPLRLAVAYDHPHLLQIFEMLR